MKKILSRFLLGVLLYISPAIAIASDFGELLLITDTVTPDGKNGVITQEITAITNEEGITVFPAYKKNSFQSIKAISGNMMGEPKKEGFGDTSYHIVQFEEKAAKVQYVVTYIREDFYEGEEADIGDTFPQHILEVSYKTVNTTALDIGEYVARIATPKDKELLNIVNFKAKKKFSIFVQDGYKFAEFNFEDIAAGEETKLAININQPSNKTKILVWVLGLLIAAFYMYKSRGLLVKAREIKETKTSEKKA